MASLLGLTILSFFISIILLVPFIDFLYRAKLRRQHQETRDMFNERTPLFDKFNKWKVGTPVGGGILIIIITTVITLWSYGILAVAVKGWELFVILFSFIGFGLLGFYDDWKKIVGADKKGSFFGLRFRHKFIIQWILAFIIASVFYFELGYSFLFIHGVGLIGIGALFIPFAAFVIVSFVNAVNITDGLDGLASGLVVICLVGFLAINSQQIDRSLGVFISVLLGSVMAFLYFNIYKARIWVGDVGALSMGAALAVIGLLTGKTLTLAVIGGVFIIEIASSLLQILSKKYFKRKLFPVAPFHLYLQQRGWEEPKIVMRAWLIGIFFAVLGVYLGLVT
ncbi:MAG TPA: phospho-N-acetylmuramoyl-pentapeptide-transferase [Patescibacteria group bacterium]|nr:phospho-N-acetylmuramoyl-pentapeptide-transferase [Patescibacteria group bacterium]